MKLKTQDIRSMLASFYSKACMDEKVDMKQMVALLDYFRETFEKNDVYEVWNNIRVDHSKYAIEPYSGYIIDLKREFFSRVTELITASIKKIVKSDAKKGFDEWLVEYAKALTRLLDPIYSSLCQTDFGFNEEQQKQIDHYNELNLFILDSKWPEAFADIRELSDNTLFDDVTRSNLKIIAAEIQLFWHPDYRNAIKIIEEAKALCPDNARIERVFGEYYGRLAEYEKAKNHYMSAITNRPNDIDNYIGMGNIFLFEGNREAAEQWYEDAININFLDPYSYSRIINLYNTQERIIGKDNMIEDYLALASRLDINPATNNALYNFYRDIGLTYSTAKQYDNAVKYYETADALKPELTAAKVDLGYTLCHAKNFDGATAWLTRSLKDDERWNFDTHWAFGWVFEQMAKEEGCSPEEKENLLRQAMDKYSLCATIRKEWTDRCLNLIGILHYHLGLYKESVNYYEQAISINPHEIVYYNNKRDALEKASAEPQQIEDVLKTICDRSPTDPEAFNRLGVFYHKQGDYRKAIPEYDKAIQINPNVALYYENRGLAYLNLEEYKNAEGDYLKSCGLNTNGTILNKLGVLYYRMQQNEKAVEYYGKAIKHVDDEPIFFENIGLAYEKLKEDDKAIEAYEKAIELEKVKGTYLNRLGLFYYNKADDQKAIEYYEKAIEREPRNPVYLENLALAHEQLHRDEEAEKIYNEVLDIDRDNARVKARLAVIGMRKGAFDESVYHRLNQAVVQYPNNLRYLEYLGFYYEKTNSFDSALTTYERALAIDPDNEYFNNRAGVILYNNSRGAEDIERSINHYQKAIEKNSNTSPSVTGKLPAVYWQNLGLAYEKLGRLDEAEEAFLTSIGLDPENDEYLNFLGVFYNNKLLDYNKALEYYKKAASIKPKPVYYDNIGYVYKLLNEPERAEEAYAKARSL